MIDDIYDNAYYDEEGDLQEYDDSYLERKALKESEINERYDLVKDFADKHYRANGFVRLSTMIELTGFDKIEIIEYLQEEEYEEINDGMFTKINGG